jgi:serine/threonine-protein phosphatase CPPED1
MRSNASVFALKHLSLALIATLLSCTPPDRYEDDDEEEEPVRPGDDGKNDSAQSDSGGAGDPVPTQRAMTLANAIVRSDSPTTVVPIGAGLQSQGGSVTTRTLIKFEIPATPIEAIGGLFITRLRLFVTNGSQNGIAIHLAEGAWDETVTFSTAPMVGAKLLAVDGPIARDRWLEIDVPSLEPGPVSIYVINNEADDVVIAPRTVTTSAPELLYDAGFFFLQMADTQLGKSRPSGGMSSVEVDLALMRKAIAHANRLKPAFITICGDLVNERPMGTENRRQVRLFKEALAGLDPSIKVRLLTGNHDVDDADLKKPTPTTINWYKEQFGDDFYAFSVGGTRFVAIDSSVIKDPSKVRDHADDQDDFIRRELNAASNAQHVFMLQHHPWLLTNPSDKYELRTNRSEYLSLLKTKKVEAVWAGHYHQNDLVRKDGIEHVTTSAIGKQLGDDESGFRIVRVFPGFYTHRYFDLDHVPDTVR